MQNTTRLDESEKNIKFFAFLSRECAASALYQRSKASEKCCLLRRENILMMRWHFQIPTEHQIFDIGLRR